MLQEEKAAIYNTPIFFNRITAISRAKRLEESCLPCFFYPRVREGGNYYENDTGDHPAGTGGQGRGSIALGRISGHDETGVIRPGPADGIPGRNHIL